MSTSNSVTVVVVLLAMVPESVMLPAAALHETSVRIADGVPNVASTICMVAVIAASLMTAGNDETVETTRNAGSL